LYDFTKIAQSSHSNIARHISKNALNPILFLCLIATPICFVMAYLFKGDALISRSLLAGGILPVLIGCGAYIGFAIFKPEKLQSETYQLRHEAMQLVAQKGKSFLVSEVSLEVISNPALNVLGTGEDGEHK
jgi:hypothetical protein